MAEELAKLADRLTPKFKETIIEIYNKSKSNLGIGFKFRDRNVGSLGWVCLYDDSESVAMVLALDGTYVKALGEDMYHTPSHLYRLTEEGNKLAEKLLNEQSKMEHLRPV